MGDWPEGQDAPKQATMDFSHFDFLEPYNGLLVKQTTRGCIQELCGCEAKSEYKVSDMDWGYLNDKGILLEGTMTKENVMYILENSGFCCRCCWQEGRPMDINVSAGGEAGGKQLMQFSKATTCQICVNVPIIVPEDGGVTIYWVDCPMCCCLPYFDTKSTDGQVFSKSVYVCDICLGIPKYDYFEGDKLIYKIRPPVCPCCPCCIQIKCCSGRFSIPFYFWDPETGNMIGEEMPDTTRPQITKVWAGLAKECCTTADNFAIMFPPGCSNERKAGLVGATMLIDLTWFEGHD